jgi:hypothetical protein
MGKNFLKGIRAANRHQQIVGCCFPVFILSHAEYIPSRPNIILTLP